jgi:hypothetical protein
MTGRACGNPCNTSAWHQPTLVSEGRGVPELSSCLGFGVSRPAQAFRDQGGILRKMALRGMLEVPERHGEGCMAHQLLDADQGHPRARAVHPVRVPQVVKAYLVQSRLPTEAWKARWDRW